MIFSYNTMNSSPTLDPIEVLGDDGITLTEADIKNAGVEFEVVESIDQFNDLLAGDDEVVCAKITTELTLGSNDSIAVPAGKEVYVDLESDITCTKVGFTVADNSKLTLSGNGTLKTKNKTTSGAIIEANGANALVVIDGVTLDAITEKGKANNYAHAIYLMNNASIEFKSGVIKTAYGSCITTNNTTGGAGAINISGGELYSDGSYALYIPSQSTINITGGIVQGINARMGKFNISGNAKIVDTTITESDYDDIGLNIATSGCIWFGDTIAIVAGTYTDTHGTDCELIIADNATVHSSFRSAIGIYEVDTKEKQNVEVFVAVPNNVVTTAEGFNNIEIYDHEYIAARAAAYDKPYDPIVQSEVVVNIAD